MSTGSGGKPPSGSQPGRSAAETPQRLIVRSGDGMGTGTDLSADTAVASRASMAAVASAETPTAGTPALDIVGVTLSGRYLITRKVGQGGMGAVYEATHIIIGKRVAVKVLLEKYAKRDALVARLKKEAQLASSLPGSSRSACSSRTPFHPRSTPRAGLISRRYRRSSRLLDHNTA